jgi:hypothetical protein
MRNDRITATLRRRIQRASALRETAHKSGDIEAWKRHADRGNRLRGALLAYVTT